MADTVPNNESLSSAPPPPSEVKIRTMQSDLESMAKSGGGMPRFENVKISGLAAAKASETTVAQARSKSYFLLIVVVLVVIAALAVGGWFAYQKFFAGNSSAPALPQANNTIIPSSTSQGTAPTTTPIVSPPAAPFVHASFFFKQPADQVLTSTLYGTGSIENASDLQTYDQAMTALLATAKKTDTLVEIDETDSNGNAASVSELLTAANAAVINSTTLATDFNPDATFFAYRDKNGFWPGYIIALTQNQNFPAVESSTQELESSPNISNFFLVNVGTPSPDGFTSSMIASSSVRVLPFLGGTIPGYFVYGWTPDQHYLILSASQNGFAAALERMGY